MFGLETGILLLLPESVLFGWLMGNGGDEKKISPPETEKKDLDKPPEIFSRDILQSFLGSTSELEAVKVEEIELNLGLSLGNEFGVEPKALVRSSSTASFLPKGKDVSDTSPSAVAARGNLARTSSMAVETDDEKRKRKELHSLRRTEAKKRRSDERRGVKGHKEMEVDWMGDLERERNLSVMKNFNISVGGMGFNASNDLGGGIDVAMGKGKGVSAFGCDGMGSSMESTGKSSSSLMGDLGRKKHLPGTKSSDLSVGERGLEASSDIGGGIGVELDEGKGVSGCSSGGMQGFGQVVSQGSSMESTGKSSSSLMGYLEREKHLPATKKFDSSVGGTTGFEASSNLGGGIDVAMGKRKGVSGWGGGGMQGFGEMVSQGSSMESTGKSSSSMMGDLDREKHLPVMKSSDLSVGGMGFEASSNLGGIDVAMAKGEGVSGWGTGGIQAFGHVVSQGSSMESTGGSFASLSDLKSKALQGSSGELSPASTLSLRERSKLDAGSSETEAKEDTGKATGSVIQSSARAGGRDTRTSAVEDMPSVYTRGDGPSGKRVDGILYRYGTGEEVRIMCICHGTFHSPVEFVLHAGGTNVDNPLRHIAIVPNSSPLL